MGLLLLIIASVLKLAMAPFAYIYGSIKALFSNNWNSYNRNLAIAKDQYGNGLCQYLFNDILIKKNGYKFGNIDETISSVIGKNKSENTLTIAGKCLDKILDVLDPNHSLKSIDKTEYWE